MNLALCTRGLAGAVLLLTLVACGGVQKTETKINDANADYQRVQAIDRELRTVDVRLDQLDRSRLVVHGLDAGTLQRVRGLLNEFTSRGENVMSVSQRKDVTVKNGDMSQLEYFLRQAAQLKLEINRVIGGGPSAGACVDQGPAVSRQAAKIYVRGLDPETLRQIDRDAVGTEKIESEADCNLYRVTFVKRTDPACTLVVTMNQASVVHDRSDDAFVCPRRR